MAIRLYVTSPDKGVDLTGILKDNRLSVARTPIGMDSPDKEQVYVRRAVSWKGRKLGIPIENASVDEIARALGVDVKIAKALKAIGEDSKKLKDRAGGLWLVEFNGLRKIMTGPAVMKLAKKIYIAYGPEALENLKIEPVRSKRFVPGRVPAETFAKVDYDRIFEHVPVTAPAPKELKPAITV